MHKSLQWVSDLGFHDSSQSDAQNIRLKNTFESRRYLKCWGQIWNAADSQEEGGCLEKGASLLIAHILAAGRSYKTYTFRGWGIYLGGGGLD